MDFQSRADELFEFFDKNQDGIISRGEFVAVVEILMNEKGRGVSKPYFDATDLNSDNKISYQEFLKLLEKIDWNRN